MSISNFDDLLYSLLQRTYRKRVALVCGNDESTLFAIGIALKKQLVDVVFVGDCDEIRKNGFFSNFGNHVAYLDASTPDEAAAKAVLLVRKGEADILMKGLINSDNFLRAILNKENGIVKPGNILTHIAMAKLESYHKLLFFSDAAVIPYPTYQQRLEQITYLIRICRMCGIAIPRLSMIHCTEKENEKYFPFIADYKRIKELSNQGIWGKAIIDGPLDVKTSCCIDSMKAKHIDSAIEGKADALLFPDIISANAFYKTITLFCNARIAGLLQGASSPIVMSSRSDDSMTKFYSLAMAIL